MKNVLIYSSVVLLFSVFVFAAEKPDANFQQAEFLHDIKSEVKKCVIMSVSPNENHIQVRSFESTCSTLKLLSDKQAQIFIENNWYNATLVESPESDDGDLDNLEIRDKTGQLVAVRNNVPAFDSIVLAMTGGDHKLHTKIIP